MPAALGSRFGRTLFLLGAWSSLIVALSILPAMVALAHGDQSIFLSFVTTGGIAAFLSMILVFGFQGLKRRRNLTNLVMLPFLGFILLAFLGGLPRYFHAGEAQQISMILFEGMSGISTSGVSAYSDDGSGGLIAFRIWQALLSWIGAFGTVVLAVTIANHVNAGGLKLHRSPVHNATVDQGHSRLSVVAKQLLPVYTAVTLVFLVSFAISTGSFTSAIVLALGSISTAGILPAGEAGLAGGWTQMIALVGMVFGALNLDYHYAFLMGRKDVYKNGEETRAFFSTVIGSGVLLFVLGLIYAGAIDNSWEMLWQGIFMAVSAISTTGWAPIGADVWLPPEGMLFILVVLASIGGAATSASGGLKLLRILILLRHGARELARLAHPHGIAKVRYAGAVVGEKDLHAVWLTMGAFVLTLMVGVMLLAVQGNDFQLSYLLGLTALTTASPLMNLAPEGLFGGYHTLSAADHNILSMLMLLGRLELSLFLALLTRGFWRN